MLFILLAPCNSAVVGIQFTTLFHAPENNLESASREGYWGFICWSSYWRRGRFFLFLALCIGMNQQCIYISAPSRVASREFPGREIPRKLYFSREIAPGFPGKFHTIKVRLLRGMNHINIFFTSSSLNITLLHDHNFLFDIDVARNTFLDHG